ncbi:hypothetical protein KDM90_03670 [Undibacterium sp. FT137W]|uniref:histidine kinase n=2 Tax=Undibacterium fentianense TaxID=2828728 RepID=A0A941E5E5_9BURK|nr:hypothetical protein [Undibacterium fentianense]
MSMFQDKQGFMWLGTANGLARFDGRQIKTFEYQENNLASISNPLVTAILQDQGKFLWIGTRAGLDRLDLQSETIQRQVMPADISLQNRRVSGLVLNTNEKLWVAMYGGLYRFDTRRAQFERWDSPDPELQGRVFTIIADGLGGVWLGQGQFVAHVSKDGQLLHFFNTQSRVAEQLLDPIQFQVRSLVLDVQGRIWVGMENGLQIWKVDREKMDREQLGSDFDLPKGVIRSMLRDTDNAIWIGLGGDAGLRKWTDGRKLLETYTHSRAVASSLNSGAIQSLVQDSNGSLWVGTSDGGAAQADLRSKRFNLYLNEAIDNKNLASPVVMAISFVSDQFAWVGTYSNGLVRLNLESGAVQRILPSEMPLTKIKAQFLASDGKLWIGGDGGLFVFDPTSRKSREIALNSQIAAGASISSIVADRNGDVWAGSALGLYRIRSAVGRSLTEEWAVDTFRTDSQVRGAIGHDVIDSLLLDHRGRLWIGTKGGLYLWRPEHYRFDQMIQPDRIVPHPEKLAIQSMREDARHRLWLATEAGLFDLTEQDQYWTLHSWSETKGMPQGGFDSIEIARNGEIWLGNDLGLTRLIPEQQKARFYPALTHFGAGINFGASAQGPDGSLYFGTKGLIRFHPEQLKDNLFPPKVVLSDILLFNRSLQSTQTAPGQKRGKSLPEKDQQAKLSMNDVGLDVFSTTGADHATLEDIGVHGALHLAKKIYLTHRHTMVSFQLSALQFYNRGQNRYAWKLEGSDADWIDGLAEQGTATYTNLSSGNYRFYAKAANPDGVWSDPVLLLEVDVAPPFWRTWWWYTTAFLLGSALIWISYRLRVRSFHANQAYLQQEVAHRTSEVVEQREIAERARRDIALLSEIGRKITASLDPTTIQQVLYEHLSELIQTQFFAIGTLNLDKTLIEFKFVVREGISLESFQLKLDGSTQIAQAILPRQWVEPAITCVTESRLIKLREASPTIQDRKNLSLESDERTLSGLFAPLIVQSKTLGLITLLSAEANAFDTREVDILKTLSAYAAIAFDNADAYQYLQMTQAKLVEQEKLAALGSLVAGVAHELNTPLGNSLLTATTMMEMSEKFLQEIETGKMRRSSLEVFAKATGTSSQLLLRNLTSASDLIVGFKQIAVDQVSEQRRQFNLRTVCEEVALTMSNRLKREEHVLQIDMPATIVMDSFPGPFGQVISNLIMNAIIHAFHGRKQGLLNLTAELIDQRQVSLVFSDNGHGIKEENLSKIFDPFFTTRLGQGGSGLGLHICYNIIHSVLGGRIAVRSQPGLGAQFEIVLPLIAPERKSGLVEEKGSV